jgi:SAM-dependent methyltransferase
VGGHSSSGYGDAYADVYDEWYPTGDGTDDAVAALAALAAGGPVLELGAGTGRLTLPLAARGIEVWALDNSAKMLDRLRAKPGGSTVHVVEADMASFSLRADAPPFRLAFAAFNTLFLLRGREAQLECLRRTASVLAADGHLALELFVPPTYIAGGGQVEVSAIAADRLVLRAVRRCADPDMFEGQHVEITEAGIRLRPWTLSTASPAAVDEMATAAGLELVHRWARWDGTPFAPPDPGHISVYRRS